MRRILLLGSFWALVLSFLFSIKAYAGNFDVTREVIYWVDYAPYVRVTETIRITNKQTFASPEQYILKLRQSDISDIRVQMSTGEPLEWEKRSNGDEQEVVIELPDVLGKSKTIQFVASYALHDSLRINGDLLEIQLPKMVTNDNQMRISTELRVSRDLPQSAFMSPRPIQTIENPDYISYFFEPQALALSGIKGAFGEHKNYQFIIYYHLDEAEEHGGSYRLTLPPDTDYQRITLTDFSQEPKQIYLDESGNWIAEYPVSKTNSPVVISGIAAVFADPLPSTQVLDIDVSTAALDYWEQNDQIQTLADELGDVKSIYMHVVDTLTYNADKPGTWESRQGASQAIVSPEYANCMEFTDLFIALTRASGVPARRIVGYADSQNSQTQPLSLGSDVLHAWPEYWDMLNHRWVAVDPTWQHTTGGQDYFDAWDLSHLALVINDASSTAPMPPGYAVSPDQHRNIIVNSADEFRLDQQPTEVTLELNWKFLIPWLPAGGNIIVMNPGLSAYHAYDVLIVPSDKMSLSMSGKTSQQVPPLGSQAYPFLGKLRGILLPTKIMVVADEGLKEVIVPQRYRAVQLTGYFIIMVGYGTASYFVYRLARKAWGLSV